MAHCKYIYREDDKEVVSGKYSEGHRCGSKFAPSDPKHPYYGYCAGHAKALHNRGELVIPKGYETTKRGKDKYKKRGSNNSNLSKNLNLKKKNANQFVEELAKLTGSGFNAVEAHKFVQQINPYPTVESGAEKYLFAMWLLSPQDTRLPKTQSEFSTLTGVSMTKLELWRVGDTLMELFEEHRKSFMVQKGHMVDLALLAQINAGKLDAIKLYYELYPVKERELGGKGQGVPKNVININKMAFMEAERAEQERYKYRGKTVEKRITNDKVAKIEDKILIRKMKDG